MNLVSVIPELIVLLSAIVVILCDAFFQAKRGLIFICLIGLVVAAGCSIAAWGGIPGATFYNMLVVDKFAIFFQLLFLAIAALIILASADYVSKFAQFQGEYYALILLSTVGMMLMAAATEFISLFISLELTSISLYAMAGFLKNQKSTEASLKYFLLGAISSAILLYGMAFIFGFTGKTQLGEISLSLQMLSNNGFTTHSGLLLGIVLLVAGFGFKIAAFPFQMWVPDVYEGAPTPVTAYLSVASKAAGFAIIMRTFYTAFSLPAWLSQDWAMIFSILAAIGMTVGNIIAIPQLNIKRMLGYSSIAQAGYIMVGLATMGLATNVSLIGQSSLMFFLLGYTVTNLGAFIAIIAISNKVGSDQIDDYAGMIKRSPLVALALSLCMISLTGIPPTAGFMAKFYIFGAAVQHNLLWLVIIAVLNSVVSAYYYLRVIKVMWFNEPKIEGAVPSSGALRVALLLSCAGVIVIGIIPDYAMKLAEAAAKMFAF